MRAIGVEEFGGPDALRVFDVPEPQAGPGEVRIRVHAAAVNPTDTLLRAGAHAQRLGDRRPPYVPGMDAAGVVDQLGADDDGRLSVGQRVVAVVVPTGPHGGAYADKIVVPAASVVPAPEGTDLSAAATLLMNALTARLALDELGLSAGDTLAVVGAAGALGGYAVELAKADGLRVIADAKPADEKLVRELGADEIVPRGDEVAQRIRELVPDGVPGLVDATLQGEKLFGAIANGGRMTVFRGWSGGNERDIDVRPVLVSDAATDTARLDRLARQAEEGALTLRVAEVFPAKRAADAHRLLEAAGVRGRPVLDFG
ncbi:quinone oxidoreductase family protein [Streptomyces purpurogeneiscleroticus]|uniref:quinone oxidoreductase family protein n=1 Tax=Streptomyces purpurogeneiscleroticus TaxID=68259 RepID=UPI001CBACE3B|nr:NADP-dependent oxidoreductase [Streptomyces purpurogeneiscleroticus]MBZ4015601.1 alcohol dehydrogenase [Streptomyces purpurogeneiscleroticus]